jgi:hypothetical protein
MQLIEARDCAHDPFDINSLGESFQFLCKMRISQLGLLGMRRQFQQVGEQTVENE